MPGRFDWRRLTGSQWLLLLLAAFAICDPSIVRRALMAPTRLATPINAEPEPVETIVTTAVVAPMARLRARVVTTLTVSRVPHRPESPLAPPWLASALVSELESASRPLRC